MHCKPIRPNRLWVFNGCDESGYECEYPYSSKKFLTMNFKLCLNGKIGLHKITINRFTEIITQERIFEIDCDEISNLSDWSWAFKNKKGWRYTCFLTGVVSGYYKYITIANELCKLFHAYDGEKHFLITERTGKIVYEKSDKYHGLIYIGSNNFYYLKNQQVLFEKDDKWKMQTDYNIIAPITIFPFPKMVLSNVANIIKKDNMLGVVDGEGNEVIKPDYNEIICELKITAIKDHDDKMIEKYRVLCKRSSLDDLYGENGGDKYGLKKWSNIDEKTRYKFDSICLAGDKLLDIENYLLDIMNSENKEEIIDYIIKARMGEVFSRQKNRAILEENE